jgi:outer membrane receptor protein involved in Fe transport
MANKYTVLPHWDVNFSADYQWNTLDALVQRNTVLTALATAFEWKQLKAQASLLGTFVYENNAEKRRREVTPAVFISWQWLRAFYKRIFRMPTFNDLYYTDIGNIALRPEYTSQYNIGFQYEANFKRGMVQNVNIRADAYYNEVTDKIIAIPKGNGQYRWMMMNLGEVEIRGVDVSAQVNGKLPYDVRVGASLNYTFQRAQDFSDPKDNAPESGSYGGQIAYIPRHNGSAILKTGWKSWDLNYSFIYVGERYHNSSNIRENYEQPWYTHDLTLGKTFVAGAGRTLPLRIKVSAEINNIFNQQYDVVLNYPMPGRNIKVILKIEI